MKQDYYLGLDVGTNSVGWAVTDPQYNLIKAPVKGKYKNHDMWGIRLFEAGDTAAERRINRANRRRLERRKDRVKMLQDIFESEMSKVDETFFERLKESRLHREDKKEIVQMFNHLLFNDKDFKEKDYYKQYPTIYHLRRELIINKEPHDIRLVYLAVEHIIKHRGHFLLEGNVSNVKEFSTAFDKMTSTLRDLGIDLYCSNENQVKEILQDKGKSNSDKQKELKTLFEISNASDEDSEMFMEEKQSKTVIDNITKLMVGNQGDISKIFVGKIAEDYEHSKLKFSDSKYEDEYKDDIASAYTDEFAGIESIKAVYDWSILTGILGDYQHLSNAMVDKYKTHEENLKILKALFKHYAPEDYHDYFHSIDKKGIVNYCTYVGLGKKGSVKKCSEDDFYGDLSKRLDAMLKIDPDDIVLNEIKTRCDLHELLPTQRNKNNSVIPRQVHEEELRIILNNAKEYLPFLNEVDADFGVTAIEKIVGTETKMGIFNYRIPYYVGPLSTRHQINEDERTTGSNTWICRKEGQENTRIYPWNFDDVVDREKSNEKFILRMTNQCTYLRGEDVLPKNSLLYRKYMVLNELNNLKIKGNRNTDVGLKQRIYHDLFENKSRVTGKQLLAYLQQNYDEELNMEDLSGFDGNFNTNLCSYLDFSKKGFDMHKDSVKKMAEDIIKWITIYDDDKKMIANVSKKMYGNLTSDEIDNIKKLPKYSGWGNFSEKFLTGIVSEKLINEETGEFMSIIDALWNTNDNLMELLSNKYDYSKQIDAINNQGKVSGISYDSLVKDLYVSPSVKRSIWQTILIVKEIRDIMGCAPKKVFIEMARGANENQKGRTKSRKQHLIELYKKCGDDVKDMLAEIEARDERDFKSIKLYLYYTQMGKCAYSGHDIDVYELMHGSKNWDRDHIYPQSKIKDDSLDNLVLAERNLNEKKDNAMIPREWQQRMRPIWKSWLDKGLISPKKFERLIRNTEFTIDEKTGFIARQIVETRQSTKVIADVLKQIFDEKETKIVYTKAALASQFRQAPLNVPKSRLANDYHHAKDAYLNIVVGNAYNCKYTDDPYKWMKEHEHDKYSISKTMYYDIYDNMDNIVWHGVDWEENKAKKDAEGFITGGDLPRIREIVLKDTCMYTEMNYSAKGQLFKARLWSPNPKASNDYNPTIPLKKDLEVSKYGGYASPEIGKFIVISGMKGKKQTKILMGIPTYIAGLSTEAIEDYVKKVKSLEDVRFLNDDIKLNSLIILNGYPLRINGYDAKSKFQMKNNMQYKCSRQDYLLIKRIEKVCDAIDNNKEAYKFDEVYDRITEQQVNQLFDSLVSVFEKGVFRRMPKVNWERIKDNREIFMQLDIVEKLQTIRNIIKLTRVDNKSGVSLKAINASSEEGRIRKSIDLNKDDVILVNQSVTGLFENRIKL